MAEIFNALKFKQNILLDIQKNRNAITTPGHARKENGCAISILKNNLILLSCHSRDTWLALLPYLLPIMKLPPPDCHFYGVNRLVRPKF
ncbi:MAG: hypothetical protein ACI3YC_02415, partial [Alloprevotella sp.]